MCVFSWIVGGILCVAYLALVVYLTAVMARMRRWGLCLLVLIGSFILPGFMPILILILLSCGAIHEEVRIHIAS
jgi:hypothetical protein